MQGTLRDLSKGGRNLSIDQNEPVCKTRKGLFTVYVCSLIEAKSWFKKWLTFFDAMLLRA